MPRTLKVTVTDETLAAVREYCRKSGHKAESIINQDWSESINDMILQCADHRFDCELGHGIYPSRAAAERAAKKYWKIMGEEWGHPVDLRFMENGVKCRALFESPAPLPHSVLRRKDGAGFICFSDNCSQEVINRLVDNGII